MASYLVRELKELSLNLANNQPVYSGLGKILATDYGWSAEKISGDSVVVAEKPILSGKRQIGKIALDMEVHSISATYGNEIATEQVAGDDIELYYAEVDKVKNALVGLNVKGTEWWHNLQ